MIDLSKEYDLQTESRSVIRFQDCDPLRHLNNAKYFDYFFNAREDQVTMLYGVHPGDVYKRFGSTWVVYQHHIAYVRPANMGEWVRIMSRVVWFDADTVIVEYYMTDDTRKQLKTVLWTTLKYIEVATGRKTDHQPEINAYLQKILYPGPDVHAMQLGDRVKEIRDELV
jgi:acyl-CoA thioesterase FadM